MKKVYLTRLIAAIFVFILFVLGFLGIFYPIKLADIQFVPILSKLCGDFSLIALLFIVFIALLTFLFGRIYCSLICPFGILQEIFALILRKNNNKKEKNFPVKYFISAAVYGILFAGSTVLIKYIDPYSIFGSFATMSLFGVVFAIFVFVLVFFKNRFFCTNICPVGAVLGLISKISVNKLYISAPCVSCGNCAKNCPSGCIDTTDKKIDNETCIKCLKCLSVCPQKGIKYGIKKDKVEFNPKRRETIIFVSSIAALSGVYLVASRFMKNTIENVKNTIFPAGSLNLQNMKNKCLNCNLCVNNCPNKILEKANSDCPTVHINYSGGRGYCEYECNKCSSICPSGAIKRMELSEKQNTRIAIAKINDKKCVGCSMCAMSCPKGAIEMKGYVAKVDASKCIGCNRCSVSCRYGAIEIYGIDKQETI